MTRITILLSILLVLAAIPSCASPPQGGLPATMHVADSALVGKWKTPGGAIVEVIPGASYSFVINITTDTQKRELHGYLVELDGHRLCEIEIYEPDSAERERSAVPVFHYGLLAHDGDRLIHRPLRAEWLQTAAKGTSNSVYVSGKELIEGTGGTVVKDPAAMRDLLKKAVNDPKAFGEPEVLTRIK